jgi:nitroreductase
MKFDDLVKERKSIRSFKNKTVAFGDILEAIDCALQGPFAGNTNNIKFVIVEEPKTIKQLAKHANQTWVNESSCVIVVCSDETNLTNQYGERGKDYSRQQAGAAIDTILLKLTDLGIGSCWVGALSYDLVKQILKIPDHIHIEAMIPVGYEKGKAKKPRKQEIETVLRWENWKTFKRPAIFSEAPVYKE